jgi:hypothetical protein
MDPIVSAALEHAGPWGMVALLGYAAWRQLESVNALLREHFTDMRASIDKLTAALERLRGERGDPSGRNNIGGGI